MWALVTVDDVQQQHKDNDRQDRQCERYTQRDRTGVNKPIRFNRTPVTIVMSFSIPFPISLPNACFALFTRSAAECNSYYRKTIWADWWRQITAKLLSLFRVCSSIWIRAVVKHKICETITLVYVNKNMFISCKCSTLRSADGKTYVVSKKSCKIRFSNMRMMWRHPGASIPSTCPLYFRAPPSAPRFFSNGVRSITPGKSVELKMLVGEFHSILDININIFIQQVNFARSLNSFLFLPPALAGFPWRILRRRGCLWTPLIIHVYRQNAINAF